MLEIWHNLRLADKFKCVVLGSFEKINSMRLVLLTLLFPVCLSAQPLKVMTYNIRYDNPGDGINQWSNRKEKVLDLISKYDPSILGVQEALLPQLEDITRALPEYVFVGVGRDDGKKKGEFSALLYKKGKFEVLEENTFWLSKTPEIPGSKDWDAAITRVATWARLRDKDSGDVFLVINTHFDHIGKEARSQSAALLKSKAEQLAGDLPVIITGDFNCTREETPYQVMMETNGLLLKDSAPENPQGTFCNFAVGAMPCRAIDYIFISKHWKTIQYQVIADNDGKNYPSDHLPVMVNLSGQ